jgi:hypothetical protein
MGNELSKVFTCCEKFIKDSGIDIIIEKGLKFTTEGLGKGAMIFGAVFLSSRNTEPSPHQNEQYVNKDTSTYKPGYYNITPKPIES